MPRWKGGESSTKGSEGIVGRGEFAKGNALFRCKKKRVESEKKKGKPKENGRRPASKEEEGARRKEGRFL